MDASSPLGKLPKKKENGRNETTGTINARMTLTIIEDDQYHP